MNAMNIQDLDSFKDLFDHANDLIHMVQVDGKFLYINNAWKKVLGYSLDDVSEITVYDLVIPEDRGIFQRYREDVISGAIQDTPIQVRFLSSKGTVVYLEGYVSRREKDGKALYTRGIFRDVTARLHYESEMARINAELKERENNLQQLFTHAPDAIIVIDEDSLITYWNPKAEEIFGWAQEDVVGRHLADTIVPEQYREAHSQGMKRFLATGEAHVLNKTIEITALHRSGREFFISLTISGTMQRGKRAFVAFLRDIDQQKLNEHELEKKRLELQISNQALEKFAHIASHDLKEPIRKVRIFADRLRYELADRITPKGGDYLNKIESSCERLTRMIEGILNYSKFDYSEKDFQLVDLNETLNEALSDLSMLIEDKRAEITSDKLPVIWGVPILLTQLFVNLIGNALKFSRPQVPPAVRITVREVDESECKFGNCYAVAVSDNGIGFGEQYAEKIFDTFSRLHSQTEYEGSGLGLAFCKRIAEFHHGAITGSSDDTGATFEVILPRPEEAAPGQ